MQQMVRHDTHKLIRYKYIALGMKHVIQCIILYIASLPIVIIVNSYRCMHIFLYI
jgi:hypothetical protein